MAVHHTPHQVVQLDQQMCQQQASDRQEVKVDLIQALQDRPTLTFHLQLAQATTLQAQQPDIQAHRDLIQRQVHQMCHRPHTSHHKLHRLATHRARMMHLIHHKDSHHVTIFHLDEAKMGDRDERKTNTRKKRLTKLTDEDILRDHRLCTR